jgi:uncharacterized protein (DUF952 family)
MGLIFRIVTRADWQLAERAGEFVGTAHDLRDGFIHFSAAHQVAGTAAKHYAGLRDLLLVHVDTELLARVSRAELKWEVSRGGDRFPHLYGPLPLGAVVEVEPFGGETEPSST